VDRRFEAFSNAMIDEPFFATLSKGTTRKRKSAVGHRWHFHKSRRSILLVIVFPLSISSRIPDFPTSR
jgi:hypothetical protein